MELGFLLFGPLQIRIRAILLGPKLFKTRVFTSLYLHKINKHKIGEETERKPEFGSLRFQRMKLWPKKKQKQNKSVQSLSIYHCKLFLLITYI
jgi:hypothetical protein